MNKDFDIPGFSNFKKGEGSDLDDLINLFRKFSSIFIFSIIAVFVFSTCVVRVGAGERAVIFNTLSGVENKVLGEGINLIIPIVQQAYIYDVKESTYSFALEDPQDSARSSGSGSIAGTPIHSLTSDGQKVDVELSIRVRPIPEDLPKLHKHIGPQYPNKIVFPQARTVLREVLASYPVEDVYSVKRQEIQNRIQDSLKNDLAKYFIDVEEVLIRDVKFSQEFQDAIDRKQEAYQEFLKMEYIIQAEEAKRDAKILEAEGEAQSINLRVTALRSNPEFIDYKRAQVYGRKAKLVLSDSLE